MLNYSVSMFSPNAASGLGFHCRKEVSISRKNTYINVPEEYINSPNRGINNPVFITESQKASFNLDKQISSFHFPIH